MLVSYTHLDVYKRQTFNSDKKLLFSSMIEIVNCVEEQADLKDFQFGVSRFEYVWELSLIHICRSLF